MSRLAAGRRQPPPTCATTILRRTSLRCPQMPRQRTTPASRPQVPRNPKKPGTCDGPRAYFGGMRRARLLLFLFCQFGAMAPPAHLDAQVESSVELGASRLRQANVPTSNALSGGATLDVLGDRSQLRASVLASRQTESRWTGEAALLRSIAC